MAGKQPTLALAGVPRVNLMPRVENERRERLSLSRTWALFALLAVVVAVAVIAGTFFLRVAAEQRLAAEQARTTALISELATYSDVSQALTARSALEGFRSQAMARDYSWTPVFTQIQERLPEGVALLEFTLTPGTAPTDADPTTQVGATGTLTFTAGDSRAQAATVAALAGMPGLIVADAGPLFTSGETGYEFSVNVTLDQTIYSGDFADTGSAE